jgi:hypothetical protein
MGATPETAMSTLATSGVVSAADAVAAKCVKQVALKNDNDANDDNDEDDDEGSLKDVDVESGEQKIASTIKNLHSRSTELISEPTLMPLQNSPDETSATEDNNSLQLSCSSTATNLLNESNLCLKDTYERAKRERKIEEEQAELEKKRLQEILDICMEFQRQEQLKSAAKQQQIFEEINIKSSSSPTSHMSCSFSSSASVKQENFNLGQINKLINNKSNGDIVEINLTEAQNSLKPEKANNNNLDVNIVFLILSDSNFVLFFAF